MTTPYGSVDGLATFLAERGLVMPNGVTPAHALLRGSEALDATYEDRFAGHRVSWSQPRAWPRTGAQWPDGSVVTGVPDIIVQAAYEYAYQEASAPGSMSPVVVPGKVRRRERVDTVEVEYAKDWESRDHVHGQIPVVTRVEGLLMPLIGTRLSQPGILVV